MPSSRSRRQDNNHGLKPIKCRAEQQPEQPVTLASHNAIRPAKETDTSE